MDNQYEQWLETAEPGWSPASLPFLALKDTFVSGDQSGLRLRIRYYQREEDGSLRAKVQFGPLAQGPPGHAHGGGMAAILDEAMGGAAWLAGYPVVAAQLSLSFQEMLPLLTPCIVKAQVTGVEGRKVHTRAFLCSIDESRIYCQGTGLFVVLDRAQLERLPAAAAEIIQRARENQGGHPS